MPDASRESPVVIRFVKDLHSFSRAPCSKGQAEFPVNSEGKIYHGTGHQPDDTVPPMIPALSHSIVGTYT